MLQQRRRESESAASNGSPNGPLKSRFPTPFELSSRGDKILPVRPNYGYFPMLEFLLMSERQKNVRRLEAPPAGCKMRRYADHAESPGSFFSCTSRIREVVIRQKSG